MLDDAPHVPVLLDRCVELLGPALTRDGATLADATLGAGGHAERFLSLFPGLSLIGLDRDPEALRIAGNRLTPFGDRVTLVRARYDEMADSLEDLGRDVDAVGFPHLDRASQGDIEKRCEREEPALASYVASNADDANMRKLLALVTLAMNDAA